MTKTTRRGFLVGCSAAIAAMAGARLNLAAFSRSAEAYNQEILLVIFLRGGCDALNLIPPIAGDDRGYYEAARPDLQVPATGPLAALSLDGQHGLHPSAAPLHDLYQEGRLAIVNAVGMNQDTRSHFDAMAYMELGTPGNKTSSTGWITRHLQTSPSLPDEALLPTLAVGSIQPTSLAGNLDTAAMTRADSFNLDTGPWAWRDAQRQALRNLYTAGSTALHQAGVQALDTVDIIEAHDVGSYQPANGAVYPIGSFGDHLKLVAQMIKLPIGLLIATIDLGGWDTHENQGAGAGGFFAGRVAMLAEGLAALYTDLDGSGTALLTPRLTVVVMSEFGRRLRENADVGSDRGHGGMMLVLGGNVNGGLYGQWPGLRNDQLYDGADLAVTTDFRQVLAEILLLRLGNPYLDIVFPGFTDYTPLGIVRGTAIPPVSFDNVVYTPLLLRQ